MAVAHTSRVRIEKRAEPFSPKSHLVTVSSLTGASLTCAGQELTSHQESKDHAPVLIHRICMAQIQLHP